MYHEYKCTATPTRGDFLSANRKTPDQIRADVVAAAIDVIGRLGIDGLTHRAVAARADVSLSSTTYHYASREDIIAAAFRQVIEAERNAITRGAELVESAVDRDPSSRTAALATLMQQVISADFDSPIYLRAQYELQLYAVNKPEMRAAVRAWQDDIERAVARLLVLMGAKNPESAALIVVAAVDGLRLVALTTGQSAEDVNSTVGSAVSWLIDLILDQQQ